MCTCNQTTNTTLCQECSDQGCKVFLSTDCITLSEDLPCSGILKGQTETEVLKQLSEYICTKFNSVTNFFELINLGTGSQVYKGVSMLGKKEFRTLVDSGLINLVQGTNDITISVDEEALSTFISENYAPTNVGTGARVFKELSSNEYQFRKIKSSDGSVTVVEGTDDIDLSVDIISDHTELQNIGTNTHAQIDTHIANTSNPHNVTKAQVGLSNVPNLLFSGNNTGDETATTIKNKLGVNAISNVTTIAQIRALTGVLPNNNFYTTDLGQEGNWYYDATDTTSADNTGTILITADGKRIKRIYDKIRPEYFGAKGDGITDDTAALQAAINWSYLIGTTSKKGAEIQLSNAIYLTTGLTLKARASFFGEGIGTSILKLKNGANNSVIFIPNDSFENTLKDFSIDGNKANNTSGHGILTEYNDNTINHNYALEWDKSIEIDTTYRSLRISNLASSNCAGDGLRLLERSYLCFIENVSFTKNNGHGFYNKGFDNIGFSDIACERNGLSGIYDLGYNNRFINVKTIFNNELFASEQAGFKIASTRSLYTNIESQDNYGDGFLFDNAKQLSLVNILSDGNGYSTIDTSRGDGVSTGFRFINCRNINLKNTAASQYRPLLSGQTYYDNRYVQETPYVIDSTTYDVNVNDIIIIGNHNNYNNQRKQGIVGLSSISSNRASSYVGTTKTFVAGEPILENSKLTFVAGETINIPVAFVPKSCFSVSITNSLSSIGAFSNLVKSTNGNFLIQYVANPSGDDLIYVEVKCGGVLKTLTLELENNVFLYNTDFKFTLTVQKRGNRLAFISLVSYFDTTFNRLSSFSVTKFLNIGENDYIDVIDNLGLFNTTPGNNMAGSVKEFFITPRELREQDKFLGVISNIDSYYTYLDFNSIPNLIPNKITTLPIASSYYEGREFWIAGGTGVKDTLYKCVKNSSDVYVWESLTGKLDVTGYLPIVTAGVPLTLTDSSPRFIVVSGGVAQTINLPVTSTLTLGHKFTIINIGAATITVNSSGGNAMPATIATGVSCNFYCVLTSGTTASSWQQEFTGSNTRTGNGSLVYANFPTLNIPSYQVTPTLTAGTNAQGQGAVTTDVTVVTTTPNTPSGVTLPTAGGSGVGSRHITIINKGTNPINVYPELGSTIDSLGTNNSYQIPVNGVMVFRSTTATQWYSNLNNGLVKLKDYTVATLPTGTQGDTAYVTDALTPTYLTAVTGGGAVVTPVFHNGTTWVAS